MSAADATAVLRAHARQCIDAALAAVEPGRLVTAALARDVDTWPGSARRIALLAVGKAADAMCGAALDALDNAVVTALIVAPAAGSTERVSSGTRVRRLTGAHPIPDASSVAAAEAVLGWLRALAPGDGLLVLLSGGASSLLSLPAPGIALHELARTTALLLAAGVPIEAVNTVRKHLDVVKGGRLAHAAGERDTLVLVVSDVVGDRLDVIASGPFHPDPTTPRDALAILADAALLDAVPAAVRAKLETARRGAGDDEPSAGAACFHSLRHVVIGGNETACAAAAAWARQAGYRVELVGDPLVGEASDAGDSLGRRAVALARDGRRCIVAGGETTVTVRGRGRGGRNQELALAAARRIAGSNGIVVASFGTDGIDGPTDAAGAIVDGATLDRMRAAGFDAAVALDDNDAYTALAAAGDLVRTGPTGTNVGDVQLVLSAG